MKRVEDPKYLMGKGAFIDDIVLPRMLHAVFVRSPHAHARIEGIDTSEAMGAKGVVAVVTGEEIGQRFPRLPASLDAPGFKKAANPVLAVEKVRFVGDPVAIVVAESRESAYDAAELVRVEYQPLPAVNDPEEALKPGAPLLYEEWGDNIFATASNTFGDVEGAFREADVVLKERFRSHRLTGNPIEARGCVAHYDTTTQHLTLWTSTQLPHFLRRLFAEVLSIPESRFRVIAPDVGGGFGIKANLSREEAAMCYLGMKLGRPVKWIEGRREHIMASVHARDEVHYVELAAKKDGTVLGLRERAVSDIGAYSAVGWSSAIEIFLGLAVMTGPYRIRNYAFDGVCVATNKCTLNAYRGVGEPAFIMVVERLMDTLAKELGIDPAEVRRRNIVKEFPYTSVTGFLFDSGDYVGTMEKALRMAGYGHWRGEQERLRREGRYIGIGISCNNDHRAFNAETRGKSAAAKGISGLTSIESATIRVLSSGHVAMAISASSHGQGHETVFAQVAADELGVDFSDITVLHGDTDVSPFGVGTWGSRATVMQGGACITAARKVREKMAAIAAHLLEARREDIEVAEGVFRVKGAPFKSVGFREVARIAYTQPYRYPPELGPGIEETSYFDSPAPLTVSNTTQVMVVEVDIETGKVEVLKYVLVEDCGTMINPMIVEAQAVGGAVQGLGEALLEEVVYDGDGQLLTGTLMDYLMPKATETPHIEVGHVITPSPLTVGGFKSMGEGGTMGASAVVANAIADALTPFNVNATEKPFTPERVWRLIRASKTARA